MPAERLRDYPQFLLRLFLFLGFVFPVLDRLGLLGPAGTNGNAWGNWPAFVDYCQVLIPYLSRSLVQVMGAIATGGELVFGIGLLLGYQTKWMAIGSGCLTLAFALSMLFFSQYRDPFTYSVFVVSAGSFLLASIPYYRWSIDAARKN